MLEKRLLRELEGIVGREQVLSSADELLLYQYDGSVERGRPDAVVFPGDKRQVADIVRWANRRDTPIVGRGAGTGLSGGALAAHAGFRDVARQLARRSMELFAREDCDAVITNAAGCGSTLKEYGMLFARGAAGVREEERELAEAFSRRVRDASEFLDELGLAAPLRAVPLKVTYQDSCHLAHGQKIREAPRRLMGAIPGIELVEMDLADQCCGSAGVYNVTETDASMALLAEKMQRAQATGASAIVTANPGCILQLRAGVAKWSTGQEVLHVVELLDRALATARSSP